MILVFLGPPGAGKGTQAKMLCEKHGLSQISTGDILRKAVADKTEMGLVAKEYMDHGKLVPDEVVIGIIRDVLSGDAAGDGYILDGFPRTIAQARSLDELLLSLGRGIDFVVDFHVEEEDLLKRLTGRRTCKNCGFGYHIEFSPSVKEGVCDKCGGELYQRADDNKETVHRRFEVYKNQSEQLKSYYGDSGRYHEVNGGDSMGDVFGQVERIVAENA